MTLKTLAYEEVDTEPAIQFSVQQVSVSVALSYWNPVTGAWQSTPPTFAVGLQGGVRFRVTNNLTVSYYFRGEAAIRRPDGSYQQQVGVNKVIAAGGSSDWEFMFATDQAGTWQHNVAVYAGVSPDYMTLTVSQGWSNAAFAQVAAAGTITGHEFQNPATGAWQTTAPTLYLGQTLGLRAWARNDSGAQMRTRMDAEVTDPLGNVSTLPGAETIMAAGEQGSWTFSIPLDEIGTWTVVLILYGELV